VTLTYCKTVRDDASLALVDALRALDNYKGQQRKALQAAKKAVDERLQLEANTHAQKVIELKAAEVAGRMEEV
jgi:hypothetical protein